MPSTVAQLSFVDTPRVCVEYHPRRCPPDATGPEWGCYAAAVNGQGSPRGWGRTELVAMTMLAERLRERVAARAAPPGLTSVDQAFAAAARMSLGDLVGWLVERAHEPVLYEPPGPSA